MTTTILTPQKNDAQIKQDVLNELKWDPRVVETEIGVQIRDGVVTLTGQIDSYAKKLAARDAAHRVAGVLDVADDIEVRVPSVWQRSDTDIAGAVRSALEWDVLVPDQRISSTVSRGWVTLDGEVDTWAQREDAGRAVQRLIGVRGVSNQILVRGPAVSAQRIQSQIEAALERQAQREARHVHVTVDNGVVTLTGTVRSWSEKSAADHVAGFAPGVVRVDDRLVVDPCA